MREASTPRKLEDLLRDAIRARDYSLSTERQYVHWYRAYVRFHRKRHPSKLGPDGVRQFLERLALVRDVSPGTQHQALCGLLFLYRHVLGTELGDISDFAKARRKPRLPVVLSRKEVQAPLGAMGGVEGLVAHLLYGTGVRLMEALRLRVKDLDFDHRKLLVRAGKGAQPRKDVPLAVDIIRADRDSR